jgi:hypothetical protein
VYAPHSCLSRETGALASDALSGSYIVFRYLIASIKPFPKSVNEPKGFSPGQKGIDGSAVFS